MSLSCVSHRWWPRLVTVILSLAVLGAALPLGAEALTTKRIAGGWTHVAGTDRCLVFYDKADARIETFGVLDGFLSLAQRNGPRIDWPGATRMAGTANQVFLYRPVDGTGIGIRLDAQCRLATALEQKGFSGNWTHVVGVGSDALLFYDARTGERGSGWLDDQTIYHEVERSFLAKGWTHIAAADHRILFYNAKTGKRQTGVFDTQGRYTKMFDGTLKTGWTHVAGTYNHGIVLYNAETGRGVSGVLDVNSVWVPSGPSVVMGKGWRMAVGGGGRSLLFYNPGNGGTAAGGYLTDAGKWRKTVAYT